MIVKRKAVLSAGVVSIFLRRIVRKATNTLQKIQRSARMDQGIVVYADVPEMSSEIKIVKPKGNFTDDP